VRGGRELAATVAVALVGLGVVVGVLVLVALLNPVP
jgi:hypothetical protein